MPLSVEVTELDEPVSALSDEEPHELSLDEFIAVSAELSEDEREFFALNGTDPNAVEKEARAALEAEGADEDEVASLARSGRAVIDWHDRNHRHDRERFVSLHALVRDLHIQVRERGTSRERRPHRRVAARTTGSRGDPPPESDDDDLARRLPAGVAT